MNHLERVIAADANAVDPRLELAELLLQDGSDVGRASELISEAERLQPSSARAARLRGWVADIQGDEPGAVEAYGCALALAPDLDLRLRRGQILERLGRPDEAAAELTQVVNERPTDRAAHSALADIFEAQGRIRDAEAEFVTLTSLAPNEPAPQRRLAAFYLRHGEKGRARDAEARARALEGEPRALRPLRPSRR